MTINVKINWRDKRDSLDRIEPETKGLLKAEDTTKHRNGLQIWATNIFTSFFIRYGGGGSFLGGLMNYYILLNAW